MPVESGSIEFTAEKVCFEIGTFDAIHRGGEEVELFSVSIEIVEAAL